MARIRSIHPGLASDEVFMTMSMAAKAAWSLLWTECDDNGVFEWKPIVLKARIFPAESLNFADVLSEYETLGCVMRVEVEGKPYGFIRNFCRYQRPKSPSYRFPLPESAALFVGKSGTSTPGLPQPSPSTAEISPQMKEEGGNREEGKKKENDGSDEPPCLAASPKPVRNAYPEDFDQFWSGYPKTPTMSKKETFDAWKRVSNEEREKAVAALPAFRAYCASKPDYPVVHACRFLSKQRADGFLNQPTILPFASNRQEPRNGNRIINALDGIASRLEDFDSCGVSAPRRGFAN